MLSAFVQTPTLRASLKRPVVPRKRLFAVEYYGEVTALEINSQRVPLVGCYFYIRPLFFGSASVKGLIDGNVVFEFWVFGPPAEAPDLIFLS
jgi:hypothetical protein